MFSWNLREVRRLNKIKAVFDSVSNNPIIKREINQTFRKVRIFWVLAIYLFMLAASASYAFGVSNLISMVGSGYSSSYDPQTTVTIYYIIFGTQLFLMTFIVPITTSSAISSEKEKQTFDLLIITKTSMYDIIMGKLLSSLMITLIMIAMSLPVYAVVFYYGGISIIQFILNFIYLISYVSVIGALGVFFSTVMKKSTAASTATISTIFVFSVLLWIGVAIITFALHSLRIALNIHTQFEFEEIVGTLFIFNPFVGFASMIDNQLGTSFSWELLEEVGFDLENDFIYAWHLNLIANILITHLLIKVSASRIAPLRKK